jgi:hypothetical protein
MGGLNLEFSKAIAKERQHIRSSSCSSNGNNPLLKIISKIQHAERSSVNIGCNFDTRWKDF